MASTEQLPDIVGENEIADRLGIKGQTVAQTLKRHRMPAPEWRISDVPLWRWATVQRWADQTGRSRIVRERKVSKESLAEARAILARERSHTALEARVFADNLAPFRANSVRELPLERPPELAGGEVDWFYNLPRRRRAELRRYMSPSPTALAIDQYLETVRDQLPPGADVEEAWRRWAGAWDALAASRTLLRGRLPARRVEGTTYDARALFGPNGAEYLAGVIERESARPAKTRPRAAPTAGALEDF